MGQYPFTKLLDSLLRGILNSALLLDTVTNLKLPIIKSDNVQVISSLERPINSGQIINFIYKHQTNKELMSLTEFSCKAVMRSWKNNIRSVCNLYNTNFLMHEPIEVSEYFVEERTNTQSK